MQIKEEITTKTTEYLANTDNEIYLRNGKK